MESLGGNKKVGLGRGKLLQKRREEKNKKFGNGAQFENAEDAECAVCKGIINQPTGTEVCPHVFCMTCLWRASMTQNRCPLCRKKFNYMNVGLRSIYVSDRGVPHNDGEELFTVRPNVGIAVQRVYEYLSEKWTSAMNDGLKLNQIKRSHIKFTTFNLSPCDKSEFARELHGLLQGFWYRHQTQLKNLGLVSERHFNPKVRLDTSAEIAHVVVEDCKGIVIVKGRCCPNDDCDVCYE